MIKKSYVVIATEFDNSFSPQFIDIEYKTNIEEVVEACQGYCRDGRILVDLSDVERRMHEDLATLKKIKRMYNAINNN